MTRLSEYIEKSKSAMDTFGNWDADMKAAKKHFGRELTDSEVSAVAFGYNRCREKSKSFFTSHITKALRIAAEEVEGMNKYHTAGEGQHQFFMVKDYNAALTDATNLLRSVDKPV